MKITAIERRRGSLYELELDGVKGPQVDVRTFDESPYLLNDSITEQQLEDLLARSVYNRAREKALFLLGLRDYGCKELETKLAQQAPPETAAAVVARLRELGLLDDEQYARRVAARLSESKHYPARRIQQELRRRGIGAELAQTAAAEIPMDDTQQALAFIEKKYYNKMHTEDSRRKVADALARRGFAYSTVRQAMQAYDEMVHTDSEEL